MRPTSLRTRTARRATAALTAALTGVLLAAGLATPAAAAPAAETFTGRHQLITLDRLVKQAQAIADAAGRDTVTAADIEAAAAAAGTRAWERDVDYTVVTGHSGTAGEVSVHTLPDGTLGIALTSPTGQACAMTTLAPGDHKATRWHFDTALGKNCSGLVAAGGQTADAPPFVDPVPPAAPTGLVVTAGDGELTLTWDAVTEPDVTGYLVHVDDEPARHVTGTTYTLDGLTNGTAYTVRVAAVDEAENISTPSDPVTETPVDLTPPDAPTDLAATVTGTEATLTWTGSNAADTASYEVFLDGQLVGTVPAGTTTYTFTDLQLETGYTVTVAAVDGAGNTSEPSDPVTVTVASAIAENGTSTTTGTIGFAGTGRSGSDYAVADDGKVYLTGGRSGFPSYYAWSRASVFDPKTNAWTQLPPMPTPRFDHGSVVGDDGKLYLVGGARYISWEYMPGATNGYYQGGTYVKTVDVYDPATNQWSTLPGVTITGQKAAAEAIDETGRLYLVGGHDTVSTYNSDGPSKLTQRFDPDTESVTKLANLPYGRYAPDIAIAGDGNVYLMGGYSLYYYQSTTYRFDPDRNAWSSAAPSLNATIRSATTVDGQGRIVRFGGKTQGSFSNIVQRYDYRTNAWTKVATLPRGLSDMLAFTDRWGRSYATAGYGWGGAVHGASDATVRLDADDTLTPVPELTTRRTTPSLTVPGDTVLVLYGQMVDRYTPQAP